MSKLTTHVLDTSAGIPAAGMIVELRRLEPKADLVQSFTTNADGRVDGPLLQGD
ncbi:MAG: hydroxyisourate hydrolase, partial [Arenicellales bacterium WSBS_2016_MAG_OTU3]